MSHDGIVRFEPKGPVGELHRWDDIPASDLESGHPVQRGHFYLNDTERGLSAGVWDCTAFTAKPGPYSVNEFMLILEGSVKEGDTVHVTASRDGLLINGQLAEAA